MVLGSAWPCQPTPAPLIGQVEEVKRKRAGNLFNSPTETPMTHPTRTPASPWSRMALLWGVKQQISQMNTSRSLTEEAMVILKQLPGVALLCLPSFGLGTVLARHINATPFEGLWEPLAPTRSGDPLGILVLGTPSPTARVVHGEAESSPTSSLRCGTFLARHIGATPFFYCLPF